MKRITLHIIMLMGVALACHAYEPLPAIHDCSKAYLTWRDYDVVPLGANLLIVTLKAPSGRLYTCLRLNGHWASPVPDGRMLVPSSELTAYWRTLMADF